MAITPRESKAVKAMIDAGIIPAECTRFELVLDAKDAIRARCEFFVTEEQLEVVAAELRRDPLEAARFIRTALVGMGPTLGGRRDTQFLPAIEFKIAAPELTEKG